MTNFDELQKDEEFRLTAPEGEHSDEPDSLGDLETNDGIELYVDDSRDFDDLDEPIDYYGADLRYEDYEPSPYDGTYSEM